MIRQPLTVRKAGGSFVCGARIAFFHAHGVMVVSEPTRNMPARSIPSNLRKFSPSHATLFTWTPRVLRTNLMPEGSHDRQVTAPTMASTKIMTSVHPTHFFHAPFGT